MNFDEFLKTVSPKIGPKNAFDLARDSKLQALEQVLIKNLGVKPEDVEKSVEEELEKLATKIISMPPPPLN